MNPLDRIILSFRCPADWNAMEGDAKKRFCNHCRKHVHNLSELTRDEAERLIEVNGGRMCVRMERRADGSTVVKDCPKPAAARTRGLRAAGAGLAAGGVLALASCEDGSARSRVGELGVPGQNDTSSGTPVPMMGTPALP